MGKNAYLYCHPMASLIYIEANFPDGNTRLLRVPTNQIEEAATDIKLDGNNLTICMETFENQRFELEVQNPILDPERKCFERLVDLINADQSILEETKSKPRKINRCAKSELDLHLKFENGTGAGPSQVNHIQSQSQEVFYSPPEIIRSPPETAQKQKPVQKREVLAERQINQQRDSRPNSNLNSSRTPAKNRSSNWSPASSTAL